jgi:hypothetical protein
MSKKATCGVGVIPKVGVRIPPPGAFNVVSDEPIDSLSFPEELLLSSAVRHKRSLRTSYINSKFGKACMVENEKNKCAL